MATESNRRRRRQTAVDQSAIIRVAARLFRRNGYDSTTMQDIAEELGILKGSLYHHIDSKEQLLITILEASVTDVNKAVDEVARSALPARAKLRELIRIQLLTMIRHQDEILIWLSERGRNPALDERIEPEARQADHKLRDVLEEGAAAGNWPITHLGLAYQAIRGMMAWVPAWYEPTGRQSADQIAEVFSDYALRLLGNPTTQERKPAAGQKRARGKD